MDLSSPTSTTNSPLTPVFGDNVQDLLNAGAINVNPTGIIVVNSRADTVDDLNSGVTTLRDAINQANADSGEDLIVFDRSLFSTAQTITLSGTELDITHSLNIVAPRDTLTGGNLVTVSGNEASRVFEIGTGATVNLSALIVADGRVTNNNGGGIKNSGTLTLDSSIVRNNSATSGGGIYGYESSNVKIQNSTISNNSAKGTYGFGGGIYYSGAGTVTVENSTVSGNSVEVFGSGGGICSFSGTVTVENSTISGNSVRMMFAGGGGGIYAGTVTVENSTVSGNSAPTGGGIYSGAGTLTVNNSTISGNSTNYGGGGGIYYSGAGTVTVENSTISGNSAIQNGGGIYNDYVANLTLLFSTVTQNQAANGGGVYTSDVPSLFSPGGVRGSNNVRNTIIAGNTNSAGGVNPDISGTFTSLGYNLIGNSTGSTGFGVTGDIVGTSANPIDPGLGTLDFNGGPTQTIALLPDSPAIDAADPTVLDTDPTTDQRGLPRVSNGRADIGAFEVQV